MLPTLVTRGRKNPGYVTLPERLRRTRKAAGMSASALSVHAGVGTRVVNLVETGLRVPRLSTVELVADALKVSPAYLAFGVEAVWEPRAGKELRCAGLAERAREAREARGLSLREVARRADRSEGAKRDDLSEGAIRSVERGRMPALNSLEKLARALGVSPSWLAYGIGPMERVTRRGDTMRPSAEEGSGLRER